MSRAASNSASPPGDALHFRAGALRALTPLAVTPEAARMWLVALCARWETADADGAASCIAARIARTACLPAGDEIPESATFRNLRAAWTAAGAPPSWRVYEWLLDAGRTRASTGSYYTSAALAESLTRRVLAPLFERRESRLPAQAGAPDESPLRILDPAAGCGVFLEAAVRRSAARAGENMRHTAHRLASLYGIDRDPLAVELARLRLALVCGARESALGVLDTHIVTADAVRCGLGTVAAAAGSPAPADTVPWPDAFACVLAAGGFDAVVGNPPYIDSERMCRDDPAGRARIAAVYPSARGNWDLCCAFVDLALAVLRPGGTHGFVVPNKLLSHTYARTARERLAAAGLSFVETVETHQFGADVYPVAYMLDSAAPASRLVTFAASPHVRAVPAATVQAEAGRGWAPWIHASDSVVAPAWSGPRLGEVCEIRAALAVAEAYTLAPLIREAPPGPLDAAWLRAVNTGTLDPWVHHWETRPLRYLKRRYLRPVVHRDELTALLPRRAALFARCAVLVGGMSRRLEALPTDGGVLCPLVSTFLVLAPDTAPPGWHRALAALLNSRLVACEWTPRLFGGVAMAGSYLAVGAPQLRELPIPDGFGEYLRSANAAVGGDDPTRHAAWVRLAGLGATRATAEGDQAIALKLDADIETVVGGLYAAAP